MKTLIFVFGMVPLYFTNAAKEATCVIRIENTNTSTSKKIERKLKSSAQGDTDRAHFDIDGTDYRCTLAFFDLQTGTMVSCEYKKDSGFTFFQSDRSGLKETNPANNLTFRHLKGFITLKTACN